MSMHERIYEGTLYWPLAEDEHGRVTCGADKDVLPYPGGGYGDDQVLSNPCRMLLNAGDSPRQLLDHLEQHMRFFHGERV